MNPALTHLALPPWSCLPPLSYVKKTHCSFKPEPLPHSVISHLTLCLFSQKCIFLSNRRGGRSIFSSNAVIYVFTGPGLRWAKPNSARKGHGNLSLMLCWFCRFEQRWSVLKLSICTCFCWERITFTRLHLKHECKNF